MPGRRRDGLRGLGLGGLLGYYMQAEVDYRKAGGSLSGRMSTLHYASMLYPAQVLGDPELFPIVEEMLGGEFEEDNEISLIGQWQACIDFDVTDRLPRCTAPLHIFAFEQDVQAPPQFGRKCRDHAHCDAHEFAGMGHCSIYGHRHETLNAEIRKIVDRPSDADPQRVPPPDPDDREHVHPACRTARKLAARIWLPADAEPNPCPRSWNIFPIASATARPSATPHPSLFRRPWLCLRARRHARLRRIRRAAARRISEAGAGRCAGGHGLDRRAALVHRQHRHDRHLLGRLQRAAGRRPPAAGAEGRDLRSARPTTATPTTSISWAAAC